MKTKIFIFLITLFIFSFKLHSFANADYSCTVFCKADGSSADFPACTIPVVDPYNNPFGCSYTCSGTPCAVSGGTCVNVGGFYSGPAGTFPCCSGLTPCSSTGTCETSCPGPTPTATPGACVDGAFRYICTSNQCHN